MLGEILFVLLVVQLDFVQTMEQLQDLQLIAKDSSSVVDHQPANGLLHLPAHRYLQTGIALIMRYLTQTLLWVPVDGLFLILHNLRIQDTLVDLIGILTL